MHYKCRTIVATAWEWCCFMHYSNGTEDSTETHLLANVYHLSRASSDGSDVSMFGISWLWLLLNVIVKLTVLCNPHWAPSLDSTFLNIIWMYLNQTYSFDGVAYSKPITILESKYKSILYKPYTRTCIL